MKKKKLVIIAGASGEIGTTYCKELVRYGVNCIAVIRHTPIEIKSPVLKEIQCHLDNAADIEVKFSDLNLEEYDQVVYLHTIGVDKFDPRGYPNIVPIETIDPDVYNTNVNTFKYLMRYLTKRIRTINSTRKNKIALKFSMIAGVADKYTPFVIESFCEAKFIVRQYIQSQVSLYPEWVSGLSINVTSTITASALAVRPHADTTYWLQPQEVVDQSLEALLAESVRYHEIDLIKKLPNFVEGYYENNQTLYEKWSMETGIK